MRPSCAPLPCLASSSRWPGSAASPRLATRSFVVGFSTAAAEIPSPLQWCCSTNLFERLTAADGSFAIEELSPGTYEFTVRRLGFEPAHASLKVDDPDAQADLTIRLTPLPLQLDPVTVVGEEASPVLQMQGFYERRAMGFGHFITREDIEYRRTNLVSELFQLIPGFRIGRGAGCKSLFLDGLYVGPTDMDMLESLLSVGDIEGIEVYTGPSQMPARFNVLGECPGPPGRPSRRGRPGQPVIVVWTR